MENVGEEKTINLHTPAICQVYKHPKPANITDKHHEKNYSARIFVIW
jgi:hypothetical protein